MPNNLVVQLLLKTGAFSDDLKTARGQIQNFQKGCSTAGKAVSGFSQSLGVNIGTLSKFGGVIGLAAAAGKGLKGVIDSTQSSADAFEGVIAGCKGVLDGLAISLASADFSILKNGLWDIYDAAKAARDALDDLGDAQMGYNMLSSRNRRGFTEAQAEYKELETAYKNAKTQEEKDRLKGEMENQKSIMKRFVEAEEENARSFYNKNFNAIKTQLRTMNPNINEKDVTPAMIYEVASIFNSDDSAQKRAEAKQKADYVKEQANLYEDDSKRYQYYLKHQRELIIAALLEMKQEKIEAVAQELQAGESARTNAAAMRKTYDRTIRGIETQTSGGVSTTTGVQKENFQKDSLKYWQNILEEETKYRDTLVKGSEEWKLHNDKVVEATEKIKEINDEELKIQDGSLAYWQNILAEETKYRDALKIDTEEWKLHNDKVKEATEKIKEIKEAEEEREKHTEGSLNYLNDLLSKLKNQRDALSPDTEEWDKVSQKIAVIERLIENIDNKNKLISLENAMSVQPPTIASLREVVRLLTELRDNFPIGSELFNEYADEIKYFEKLLKLATPDTVDTGVVDEDKKWQSFNQTMANTSTIANALFNTFKEGSEITAASILQMISTTLPAIGSLISAISALTSAEAVEAGVAATGKAVSTSKHWIEAIAAVASLGAVVATAISAASKPNLQRFAEGGIVGGSSFTGDRVPAMVNSGEMILNKTQQARLFKIANGGAPGDNAVTFHISGTDLVGVLNNNSRKNKLIR